jgi:hypothetical protein
MFVALLIRQRNAPLLDTLALNHGFVAIATRLYGAGNVELRKAKSAFVRSEESLLGRLMSKRTVEPVAVRPTNDDGHARSACFVLKGKAVSGELSMQREHKDRLLSDNFATELTMAKRTSV